MNVYQRRLLDTYKGGWFAFIINANCVEDQSEDPVLCCLFHQLDGCTTNQEAATAMNRVKKAASSAGFFMIPDAPKETAMHEVIDSWGPTLIHHFFDTMCDARSWGLSQTKTVRAPLQYVYRLWDTDLMSRVTIQDHRTYDI